MRNLEVILCGLAVNWKLTEAMNWLSLKDSLVGTSKDKIEIEKNEAKILGKRSKLTDLRLTRTTWGVNKLTRQTG